ncbi:MAG: type II secretion system protein GspE [Verrucomicrobia bacterium]|nr:MAG: type II secretion system protein GspE [Verrucomicrobiota bacterium]
MENTEVLPVQRFEVLEGLPKKMSVQQQRMPLGEHLVHAGLLTEVQLDLAHREQQRHGGRLAQILIKLGFIQPEILAEFLARQAGSQTVNLNRLKIDQSILKIIPADVARQCMAMPVARHNGTLTVALSDPFDVTAVDTLQQVSGLNIDILTAPERDILNCLELFYTSGDTISESIDKILDEKDRRGAKPLEEVLSRMSNKDEDAPVIRLVRHIITRAVNGRASDIHFEPEEQMMRVRTRVDGVLSQDLLIPKAMQTAVTTRMKILADLDLADTNVPQDGRASVVVGGRQVNLRVSSLPTAYGENVVARILDPSSQFISLASLGFEKDIEDQFKEAINRPYGVVLVTGPTGSGKTTTLYGVLHEVATMEVSTFTLEDPIEYRMPLVRQTQVKEEAGLTFSSGLRALLRQDPDIILVGETRDTETAQLMVRAALTGHLVFSTLHTNDAAGAIPRLVDMQVDPFLLPASLIGIMAQRLVRTICPHCKKEVKDPERVLRESKVEIPAGVAEVARLAVQGAAANGHQNGSPEGKRDACPTLWCGAGCPECNRTGFKGRQGIFELLMIDDRFHDPILKRCGAPEYLRLGQERGMRTMFEDGLIKCLKGMSTIEELLRVTRLAPK